MHWTLHRRTQDLIYSGGYSRGGAGPVSLGDGSPPVGSRGKAPVRGLEKLKENVKLAHNFYRFFCSKFRI